MSVSLVSLLLHFTEELCLSPELSGWRVGMQNQILFQSCCIASVAKLFGSSFHAIYWGRWWRSLEAKGSTAGVPKINLLHSWTPSLLWHSTCLESTLQYLWSDKIVDNSKLTCLFLEAVNCGYHPSLRDMPELICCLLEHEWLSETNYLWMLGLQILMPVVLEYLCENASPP